ncbi:MAG TPA: helix-turn-helix transcriptional regulator [Actinocrinis sp.]|jgi:transcriptional regulator with XRE-family HTH domain|uniref:helix-turn-helix domain-containing protein n=1 Tax=Actinocrinis sp. TaxID=1920516 RepID=UPI002DDC9964|nr:helix-turn-helix transcriptional regulator [Actinocrinis sp.]HEV3173612.1 helix-turn-helix transcriptional regulator [Actinocrinis sp.]
MTDLDGITRRVVHWRKRRGLNQQEFATRLGRSRSWVAQFELGGRQADPRISVLEQVSRVLEVPLEQLLSDGDDAGSAAVDAGAHASEAAAIRTTLQRYDVICEHFADHTAAEPDPEAVETIARQAAYAWDAYQAAHYSIIGRVLPSLIVKAQRVAASDRSAGAWAAASRAYQLAAAVLVEFADGATAWHAADRGALAAEQSADPVVIASAARQVAHALTTLGRAGAALEVCAAATARLEEDLLCGGGDGLSVLGMLYLTAAVCAADADDHDRTMRMIEQAREYADLLGADANHQWSGFGPTNTLIHEVSALIRLRRNARAVEVAHRIDPAALASLPRERRTHHLADLAAAQVHVGLYDEALGSLLAAEQLASQEVHRRPRTRAAIALLAEATPMPSSRLRELARRSGVIA